ncbi:MAG: outer membrane beta-barrel protein [Bryobacteraceae bacterium]
MKQLFLLLTFTTALFGQEWRTEIKLLGGITAADLDTDHLATTERVIGGGYMAGVEGAVNLNSIFAVTGHYVYNDLGSGIRLFCDTPTCGRVTGTAGFQEYMGGIRLRGNADGRVSPYIGISVGGVRLATKAMVNIPGTTIQLQDSATKFAYAPGIGFDVKIVKHFAIGLDARYVKATDLAWYVRTGLGLTFRF